MYAHRHSFKFLTAPAVAVSTSLHNTDESCMHALSMYGLRLIEAARTTMTRLTSLIHCCEIPSYGNVWTYAYACTNVQKFHAILFYTGCSTKVSFAHLKLLLQ